jgi:hypothetical protein
VGASQAAAVALAVDLDVLLVLLAELLDGGDDGVVAVCRRWGKGEGEKEGRR